jgi:hypothetical protein
VIDVESKAPAASPGLDALILQHVFGCVRQGDNAQVSPLHVSYANGETWDDWMEKGPHPVLVAPDDTEYYLCTCRERIGAQVPAFSSDIAAAWQVIEKMNAAGYTHNVFRHYPETHYPDAGRHACSFSKFKGPLTEATADTATLAICIAALKVVGVQL